MLYSQALRRKYVYADQEFIHTLLRFGLLQAVDEQPNDVDDTELDRRTRLRDDNRKHFAYDDEQRKLKQDLLLKLDSATDDFDANGGLTKTRTLPVDSTAEVCI